MENDVFEVPHVKAWHGAELVASPSKSYSHRVFIISMLADGRTIAHNILDQGDVYQTVKFCRLMGAQVNKIDNKTKTYEIIGPKSLKPPREPIDCSNSGTSIRIIAALSALFESPISIYGEFFRRGRPMDPLLDALQQIGVVNEKFQFGDSPCIKIIPGQLKLQPIKIAGNISSQFITGLLIMTPLLKPQGGIKEIDIQITTELKSASYLDITLEVMKQFKVMAYKVEDPNTHLVSFKIPLGQKYIAQEFTVPGDFSSAAFPISFAALKANISPPNGITQPIIIKNLDFNNPQPDKAIIPLLQQMGANITIEKNEILIFPNGRLHGITIDQSQIPDLFPILATISVFCEGQTKIIHAEHVRIKETDRIKVMVRELTRMGATIKENPDGIEVYGAQKLHAIRVKHDEDHRVAMSLIIASAFIDNNNENSIIPHPNVVADSYPDFISDFLTLI
mgnify:CR=1 FL=1